MHIGIIIYGSIDTMSGGTLYDRRLVNYLRKQGDNVEIISLPWGSYLSHLTDNFHFRLPANLDILIEDELTHPSLLFANGQPHPYPVVSLVHNLHSSEKRPAWQNTFYRTIERQYLRSVDGFIFNSQTTRAAVNALIGNNRTTSSPDKPYVIATPGGDRLGLFAGVAQGHKIIRIGHNGRSPRPDNASVAVFDTGGGLYSLQRDVQQQRMLEAFRQGLASQAR